MISKKLNIIEIILHILAFMLLFIQGMFYCYITGESYSRVHNAFTDLPDGSILPIVFVLLLVVSLLFCLIWAIRKKKNKFNVIHILLPISSIVVFIFIGFLYSMGEYATLVEQLSAALRDGANNYGIGPVFLVESGLLFSIVVIAIIKKRYYFTSDIVETNQKAEEDVKNLDLLMKYKELQDDGIITQEEFEEKKKELLQ